MKVVSIQRHLPSMDMRILALLSVSVQKNDVN